MAGNSSACDGKRGYLSYLAATKAAKTLNKYQPKAHSHAYRCTSCQFYHVGGTMHKRPTLKEVFDDD